MWNRQELESLTRAQFLGNWIGVADFPTYISFHPNTVARTGIGVVSIVLSTINRAAWATSAQAM